MKPTPGKGARLTEGPVSTAIFSLMLPMILGMLAIVVNNLAGAFFVARVSTEQLAAISFTFPVCRSIAETFAVVEFEINA